MTFADIILPFPLVQTYTYAVPDEWEYTLVAGMRVIVPFGKRRFYTGIVLAVHQEAPEVAVVKEITALLDDYPVLRPVQLQFWQWISSYYRAFLGDVYKAALPTGLKLESETMVEWCTAEDIPQEFSEKEERIYQLLVDQKPHAISEINKQLDGKDAFPLIKRLLARDMVKLTEEVKQAYRPKTDIVVALSLDYKTLLPQLKLTAKQQHLFDFFWELSSKGTQSVSRKQLLETAKSTLPICKALVDKGLLELQMQTVSRLVVVDELSSDIKPLTPAQSSAYQAILAQFNEKQTVLLHGATASGKTEIYTHLIADTLARGEQVLYLVPEIALTTQLTDRLRRAFGAQLGVYHSRFSDAERVEIWNNLLQKEGYQVVIGARSALFLPFEKLGLVIVDEEHDTSYKQVDPAPRYHARNAAVVLASMHGAKVILGSATPSVETYSNTLTGKYGLVELPTRYANVEKPHIITVDLTEAYRKKQMSGHLSGTLIEQMHETLAAGDQVILFQNRRGFAPYVSCKSCGWVPRCNHCDVSLTYHKAFNRLTCHYCGYTETLHDVCPVCHQLTIETHGFGTEQIEKEVKELFPQYRVARMDLDTTRTKQSFTRIIEAFESRAVDILVGTQMVTKGLDFEHAGLVGILNADNLLHYPDFRAHERAFQLLLQVSGRAGRQHKQGVVVLQTSSPEHPVIQQVLTGDYRAFFDKEMTERELFNYPPYCRLIQIILKHRNAQVLNKAANHLANSLRQTLSKRVFGPDNPAVSRIQNYYIKHILLKIEISISSEQTKELVDKLASELIQNPEFKSLLVTLDVDPM
ncbi:MAG TPA: primosomal protein N' [Paludibacteraceae bacterium]|nr:primosomal protein N' [Paludibacteraceae bacterium]HQB68895.1 primosomal protein N' [Paludibacteraceae bacterium]